VGLRDLSPPVRSRGEAPVVVFIPQKLKQLCRHCLQILTTETIKIRKFRTNHFLILDQYVSRWGKRLSDIWGLRPLAHASSHHCIQSVLWCMTRFPVSPVAFDSFDSSSWDQPRIYLITSMWPWPADLDIWTPPGHYEDTFAHQKWSF